LAQPGQEETPMKIMKILLLASALTMPLAYATITITAEAAGKGAKTKKATKAAYKTCGTYKFWKDGKCEDARAKK
jgi:hypothetical protein